MMHLKILACDLDGTLTESDRIAVETWDLLRQAKTQGLKLILATGRIMRTFLSRGPYTELFEAIVAENGAVVYLPHLDEVELPFGRLSPSVLTRMKDLEIPLERGIAIAATRVPHDEAIMEALREMGGGATIEYNRQAVMLSPYGATKGTGLDYALGKLGYSPRNVIACGDAENDRSLFKTAELAVALANSPAEIKDMADALFPMPDGAGVRGLVKDLLDGRVPTHQQRPHRLLSLGQKTDGTPLHLDPFDFVDGNSGIFGASGSGKSWLAGLLAEELLKQGYQICIIDPEGDYRSLQAFADVIALGGLDMKLPSVVDIISILERARVSLELDLSAYNVEERTSYIAELIPALRNLRSRRGRPHWFLIDEIQSFCPLEGSKLMETVLETMQGGGFSIVSYRPSQVSSSVLELLDHWLMTRLSLPEDVEVVESLLPDGSAIGSRLPTLPIEEAYLCLRTREQAESIKEIATIDYEQRDTPHVRHFHKYLWTHLPETKRFRFYDSTEHYLGIDAANLWEFREVLTEVPVDSIQYHMERRDFERWIGDVIKDDELVSHIRKIAHRDLAGESLRQELLEAVIARYEELSSMA